MLYFIFEGLSNIVISYSVVYICVHLSGFLFCRGGPMRFSTMSFIFESQIIIIFLLHHLFVPSFLWCSCCPRCHQVVPLLSSFIVPVFLVGAGSSHTQDVKNGSGPCLHGTRMRWGPRKLTGWPGVRIK